MLTLASGMYHFGVSQNYVLCMVDIVKVHGHESGEKVLTIDYTLAFGNSFPNTVIETEKTFRYVHLSRGLIEKDQDKSLCFLGICGK